MPSFNLTRYLRARASGATVEDACEQSGIGLGEAELHEKAIERGELKLPRARARTRENQPKVEGTNMLTDEEAKVTMKVGNGPEVPIDLKKGLDAPENADAKDQIGAMFAKPATDTGQRLKLFIERVERLEQEIKDLNSDKSDVFQEAKSTGFDTATMKRIIKLRKMDSSKRQEAEALLETYMNALGMTPIEHAIAIAA